MQLGKAHRKAAFTLVELLVVIGIIAILIGILLPALAKARESGNAIKCAAHMRAIAQGMAIYLAENRGTYPAAYIYNGMTIDAAGNQVPDRADTGYIHWSSFLYGRKDRMGNGTAANQSALNIPAFSDAKGWEQFTCPSLEKGGLPPTNTYGWNRDAGQVSDDGDSTIDFQAVRCAFTVNEAICPRNKFVKGFQGAKRNYRFVRASRIRNAAGTVLATEWHPDWHVVAGPPRSDTTGTGSDTVCKSHRPIHGFKGIAGGLDMDQIPPDEFRPNPPPTIQRVRTSDLMKDPNYAGISASKTRLDWVGRNHFRKLDAGGYNIGKSNFLYVDGHVETKQVKETIEPWQWGEEFYSLQQSKDILNQ